MVKGSGTRLVRPGDEKEDGNAPLYTEVPPVKEPVTFTAIPYPYWNNRGVGEMIVWMMGQ